MVVRMNTTVLTFRCPDDLIAVVDRLAEQLGATRSDVLRAAIKALEAQVAHND
jgi:predicted transcriptional regulator